MILSHRQDENNLAKNIILGDGAKEKVLSYSEVLLLKYKVKNMILLLSSSILSLVYSQDSF